MSKSPRCCAPQVIPDVLTLVDEDRAEIVPFHHVGSVVHTVSEQCLAMRGYRLQLMLIERNAEDVTISVAAARALANPDSDSLSVLLQVTQKTPWFPLVQHVLTELAIAYANTIFAGYDHG